MKKKQYIQKGAIFFAGWLCGKGVFLLAISLTLAAIVVMAVYHAVTTTTTGTEAEADFKNSLEKFFKEVKEFFT